MNSHFAFDNPNDALSALARELSPVAESNLADSLVGKVLAAAVVADRDSPAADVSAMDGYGIRLEDLQRERSLEISGESKPGAAPPAMTPGKAIRIFTGAIVPAGCEAVIKREDTDESGAEIRLTQTAIETTELGTHIRRAGENAAVGAEVLPAGTQITPAVVAALANFGSMSPPVDRPVRVAILTTGDEVVDPDVTTLEAWQLRNSNREAVAALVRSAGCAELTIIEHVADQRDRLEESLRNAVETCDAVVLTGGVSKGDYDYVPDCVRSVGGNIVFHGLPIRPGKPILGAATGEGKLILGLPGNPVSATINAHRFLLPLLARLAGQVDWNRKRPHVELVEGPHRPIPLHAMLLVRLCADGKAEIVASRGSGDLVALSRSEGYVSVMPDTTATGPWPFFSWR